MYMSIEPYLRIRSRELELQEKLELEEGIEPPNKKAKHIDEPRSASVWEEDGEAPSKSRKPKKEYKIYVSDEDGDGILQKQLPAIKKSSVNDFSLDISGSFLGKKDFQELACFLQGNEKIVGLNISSLSGDGSDEDRADEYVAIALNTLVHCTSLRTLKMFYREGWMRQTENALIKYLQHSPSLTSLEISFVNKEPRQVVLGFASALENNQNLRKLKLNLSGDLSVAVANALKKNTTLITLSLMPCYSDYLGDPDPFISVIPEMHLKCLDLSELQLKHDQLKALFQNVSKSKTLETVMLHPKNAEWNLCILQQLTINKSSREKSSAPKSAVSSAAAGSPLTGSSSSSYFSSSSSSSAAASTVNSAPSARLPTSGPYG